MSDSTWQAWYVGTRPDLVGQLQEVLGTTVQEGLPPAEVDGDAASQLVFLEAFSGGAFVGLPGGNAFATCRDLKKRSQRRVFMLVEKGDQVSTEIARFCLADGCFYVDADGLQPEAGEVRARLEPRRNAVSVDKLLERLEREIASDEGRQASGFQRLLAAPEEDQLLDSLVDHETGLFDGPFASFKIDEEFKRASRFHQPLSLVLLDVGMDPTTIESDEERKLLLADVASVLLNECRDIDILARFTAQVFLLLLPGTGSQGAAVLSRRILEGLRERDTEDRLRDAAAGAVTMPSAGIRNRRDFLARAEACLEVARRGEAEAGLCTYSE